MRTGANAQARRRLLEQQVAGTVAERVVDQLEIVEIERQYCQTLGGVQIGQCRSSRSWNCMRLGKLVNASCRARWAICSCARRRSVVRRKDGIRTGGAAIGLDLEPGPGGGQIILEGNAPLLLHGGAGTGGKEGLGVLLVEQLAHVLADQRSTFGNTARARSLR